MARRSSQTGNGDVCPVAADHGQMLVLTTGGQYCPDQSHDGRPKSHPLGKSPATRNKWPGGHVSFAKAVEEYTATTAGEAVSSLPDIDMEAFNA